MPRPARAFLETLFRAAVAAAHPAACLPPLLPPPPAGRLIVLAAGKAAGSMAEVAEEHYLDDCGLPANRLAGVAVARHGYGRPTAIVADDRGRPSDPRRRRARSRRARARRWPMARAPTISCWC